MNNFLNRRYTDTLALRSRVERRLYTSTHRKYIEKIKVCAIMTTAVAATIAEIIHFEIHGILKWLMTDLAVLLKVFRF